MCAKPSFEAYVFLGESSSFDTYTFVFSAKDTLLSQYFISFKETFTEIVISTDFTTKVYLKLH